MSTSSTFAVSRDGAHVARVTFSNPPVNLVGADTVDGLSAVIDALSADQQVKVVVFDSGLDGFFLNHADLSQMADLIGATTADGTPRWIDLVTRISTADFVSIASIRGRTRGGGDELTLAFDLRYASREKATFGQPEVATGLVPGGGGSDRLPRLVGRDRALEIILTGDDYDATRAEQYGWITRALPDAELDEFVRTIATRIASFDRQAIAGAKAQVNRSTLPTYQHLGTSWAELAQSAGWPGFQARIPQFGALIEQIGLDEVEANLGRYLGMAAQS